MPQWDSFCFSLESRSSEAASSALACTSVCSSPLWSSSELDCISSPTSVSSVCIGYWVVSVPTHFGLACLCSQSGSYPYCLESKRHFLWHLTASLFTHPHSPLGRPAQAMHHTAGSTFCGPFFLDLEILEASIIKYLYLGSIAQCLTKRRRKLVTKYC